MYINSLNQNYLIDEDAKKLALGYDFLSLFNFPWKAHNVLITELLESRKETCFVHSEDLYVEDTILLYLLEKAFSNESNTITIVAHNDDARDQLVDRIITLAKSIKEPICGEVKNSSGPIIISFTNTDVYVINIDDAIGEKTNSSMMMSNYVWFVKASFMSNSSFNIFENEMLPGLLQNKPKLIFSTFAGDIKSSFYSFKDKVHCSITLPYYVNSNFDAEWVENKVSKEGDKFNQLYSCKWTNIAESKRKAEQKRVEEALGRSNKNWWANKVESIRVGNFKLSEDGSAMKEIMTHYSKVLAEDTTDDKDKFDTTDLKNNMDILIKRKEELMEKYPYKKLSEDLKEAKVTSVVEDNEEYYIQDGKKVPVPQEILEQRKLMQKLRDLSAQADQAAKEEAEKNRIFITKDEVAALMEKNKAEIMESLNSFKQDLLLTLKQSSLPIL